MKTFRIFVLTQGSKLCHLRSDNILEVGCSFNVFAFKCLIGLAIICNKLRQPITVIGLRLC